MTTLQTGRRRLLLVAATLCLTLGGANAEDSKTVIGPLNPALYRGAEALREGDGEEGVRLTLKGLKQASSVRDKITARTKASAMVMIRAMVTA